MPRSSMPLALLLATLPFAAPLAGQSWRPVGPDGGISGTLAAAPSQPGLVYLLGRALIDVFPSLYKSADGGQHWQGVPGDATVVALLGVDPRNASTLYGRLSSGSQEVLAKSADGGVHWAAADHGLEAAEALAPVGAPVLVRGNPSRLVVPTVLGLFESADGAASWQPLAFAGTTVDAFAVDAQNPAHWLAAVEIADPGFCPPEEAPCTHPDVLESRDAGRTWVSTGYRAPTPSQIVMAARQTFLLVDGAVFQRSPGKPWRPAGSVPQSAYQLVSAPSGTLYAATGLGIYRSTDGGASWQPSAAKARPVDTFVSLALLPDAAETVLAAGIEEIWRSEDGGGTWLASSKGLFGNDIGTLVVAADSTVYAAPAFDGVEASANGGRTWTRRNRGLGVDLPPFSSDVLSFSIGELATDPNDAATLYATVARSTTPGSIARTTDRGASWQILPPLPTGGTFFLRSLVVSPDSSRLFAIVTLLGDPGGSSESDVLLRSTDGGASWRQVLADGLAIAAVAIDPQRPATLYAWTFRQGLLKSADGGASWQATDPHLPSVPSSEARTLVVDPQRSQTIYAGSVDGVYVSRDGGAAFTAMNAGLPSVTYSRRLLIDPRRPKRLYLLDQAGVFRWLADEATWAPLDDGLPPGLPLSAGDLAIDPGNPDILYLGTDGRGVYRLDLGASP